MARKRSKAPKPRNPVARALIGKRPQRTPTLAERRRRAEKKHKHKDSSHD